MDITVLLDNIAQEARKLEEENNRLQQSRNSAVEEQALYKGENMQLRAELESVKLALADAQGKASDRKAMIAELTAQLGMLGKFFIHGSDEITKILSAVQSIHTPPEPHKSSVTDLKTFNDLETTKEYDTMVGPFVGKDIEPHHIKQEGDTNIPFAPRTKLLSETAIPIPAFLQKNIDPKEMTFSDRKRLLKNQRK